ncbi:hypothetical protein [Streptomyces phaeochromogenes]|uniref:hypothetical protein n=1 Tax=Streptomyces phaeochromogenes TaxID=1923 RepID=UPI003710C7E9
MHNEFGDRTAIDAPAGDDFGVSLQRFASGLSPSEHAILVAVLNTAMGPWKRMAARPVEELLEPAEAQLVDRLMKRPHSEEN